MKWTTLPNGTIVRTDEAEDDIFKIWFHDLIEHFGFKFFKNRAIKNKAKEVEEDNKWENAKDKAKRLKKQEAQNIEEKLLEVDVKVIAIEKERERRIKRRWFWFWVILVFLLSFIINIWG